MKKNVTIALISAIMILLLGCPPTTDNGGDSVLPAVPSIDAVTPEFETDLSFITVGANASIHINVAAMVTDGGTISYQWYSNTSNSNHNGTPISGATSASYTPQTNVLGTFYYYVIATNKIIDNGDGGQKTASTTSNVAKIDVIQKIDAHEPTFTTPLISKEYKIGNHSVVDLDGTAEVTDCGTITYQWYRNSTNSSEGGTPISGETGATYTPPTDVAGTNYYYVVATNKITDNDDGGQKTATKTSTVAEITIDTKIYRVKGTLIGAELTISPDYESTATSSNFKSLVKGVTNPDKQAITKVIISVPVGATIIPETDLLFMFSSYINLTEIVGLENLNTTLVTNMTAMFHNCYALKSLDLSSFDTALVTNMDYMFYNCYALESLDLSSFNTSLVTNMSSLFYYCSALESITFGSSFNTSLVTDMTAMFEGCSALTSLDLSGFDTSGITDPAETMFRYKFFDNVTVGSKLTKEVSNFIFPLANSNPTAEDDIYSPPSDRRWVAADGTESVYLPLNEEGTHAIAGTYTAKRAIP